MREFATAAIAVVAFGCGGARTANERDTLERQAQLTVNMMIDRDPSLRPILQSAPGYVVFPEIGKGGLVIGAAAGSGVLFENGRSQGIVQLQQGSIGAQAGAQTFAELIVFRRTEDIQKLRTGTFSLGANASAVALTSGAASAIDTRDDVSVFVMPRGGVMAELTVSGQRLQFEPEGG